MFEYCVGELGFSEDAAYSRITVARAARRFPAMIEAVRSGQVHLTGLKLLAPHLNGENHRDVLARAARKTKSEIEEQIARLAPKPPVASTIRKLPERPAPASAEPLPLRLDPAPARPPPQHHQPAIAPLAEETYKVQFTATRGLRDKLRQAQELLRHRVPDGDLACIVDQALDLLIEQVKKERFAVGRKPKQSSVAAAQETPSRHIPDPIRRKVYERDGGRCSDAAPSSTSAGAGARRPATWSSNTWTGSRSRTCTMRAESACSAAPTTRVRQKRSTGALSWSEHDRFISRLVLERAAMRQAMSRPNSTCRSKAGRRHHPRLPRPEKQGERSSFSSAEDESTTRAVSNHEFPRRAATRSFSDRLFTEARLGRGGPR